MSKSQTMTSSHGPDKVKLWRVMVAFIIALKATGCDTQEDINRCSPSDDQRLNETQCYRLCARNKSNCPMFSGDIRFSHPVNTSVIDVTVCSPKEAEEKVISHCRIRLSNCPPNVAADCYCLSWVGETFTFLIKTKTKPDSAQITIRCHINVSLSNLIVSRWQSVSDERYPEVLELHINPYESPTILERCKHDLLFNTVNMTAIMLLSDVIPDRYYVTVSIEVKPINYDDFVELCSMIVKNTGCHLVETLISDLKCSCKLAFYQRFYLFIIGEIVRVSYTKTPIRLRLRHHPAFDFPDNISHEQVIPALEEREFVTIDVNNESIPVKPPRPCILSLKPLVEHTIRYCVHNLQKPFTLEILQNSKSKSVVGSNQTCITLDVYLTLTAMTGTFSFVYSSKSTCNRYVRQICHTSSAYRCTPEDKFPLRSFEDATVKIEINRKMFDLSSDAGSCKKHVGEGTFLNIVFCVSNLAAPYLITMVLDRSMEEIHFQTNSCAKIVHLPRYETFGSQYHFKFVDVCGRSRIYSCEMTFRLWKQAALNSSLSSHDYQLDHLALCVMLLLSIVVWVQILLSDSNPSDRLTSKAGSNLNVKGFIFRMEPTPLWCCSFK